METDSRPKATHRCKVCGGLWALVDTMPGDAYHYTFPDGFWTWVGGPERLGKCCDNAPMGDQIEELR